MDEKYLVYVNKAFKNPDGSYEYDLYFSETPDVVWGVDWDIENPISTYDSESNNAPEKSTYQLVKRVSFPYELKTVQEITCFSMEYAVNRIVSLAWINLDVLQEYPEKGRCVLHFGDSIEKVKEIFENFVVTFEF